jgi:effector-binding domain-containing protein
MTVDFSFRRVPAMHVAAISWKGAWSDAKVRANFARVAAWAKANRLRTGKWVFREPGERAFEVAIEVRGRAVSSGGVRRKTYPAATVASVTFDPDVVSARVVYHGITDWLRWRKREKEIRSVGQYREVYDADPWRNPKAWARTNVQVVVRR